MHYLKRIILIIALVLVSCSDNSTNNPKSLEIIPLKIGNMWIYQNLKLDSNGIILKTTYDTLEVVKDTVFDGSKWFTYYNPSRYMWFQNNDNGYRNAIKPEYWRFLDYKYPGIAGDKFVSSRGSKTIEATDSKFKIVPGEFICYKYVSYDGSEEFLCPGIGFVCGKIYNKTWDDKYYVEDLKVLVYYKIL